MSNPTPLNHEPRSRVIRLHSCLGQVSPLASPKLASARICLCPTGTGTVDNVVAKSPSCWFLLLTGFCGDVPSALIWANLSLLSA